MFKHTSKYTGQILADAPSRNEHGLHTPRADRRAAVSTCRIHAYDRLSPDFRHAKFANGPRAYHYLVLVSKLTETSTQQDAAQLVSIRNQAESQ